MKTVFLNKSSQVAIDDIIYLKSDRNYTEVYTTNDKCLIISQTLGIIAEKIDEESFIRISNSHIVNVAFIAICKIGNKKVIVKLEDGLELNVSRRRISSFNQSVRQLTKPLMLVKLKRKKPKTILE